MRIMITAVMAILIMSHIHSQEVAKSLTIGNHWHYNNNYSSDNYSTELVIGDTCIQGINYKIIGRSPNYFPLRFERSDSTKLYQYDFSDSLEHIEFDLNWELGEPYNSYFNGYYYNVFVSEKGISAFWGSREYIILVDAIFNQERTYVETLGLYDDWGYNGQWDWHTHLIGAQIDGVNYGTVVDTNENLINLDNSIINNYPNPFNPSTRIEFSIQNISNVELAIFNTKGQIIKTLINNELTKGSHSIIWGGDNESGKSVGSGVYHYKLSVDGKTEAVKKCLLLK